MKHADTIRSVRESLVEIISGPCVFVNNGSCGFSLKFDGEVVAWTEDDEHKGMFVVIEQCDSFAAQIEAAKVEAACEMHNCNYMRRFEK